MADGNNTLFHEMMKAVEGQWRSQWPNDATFGSLHKGFKEALWATSSLIEAGRSLKATGKLSALGLREEVRQFAQSNTVPVIRKAAYAAEQGEATRAARRASLAIPPADPQDLAGAMLRSEMRAWFSRLPSGEKMQRLLDPKVDGKLLLATMEVPPEMAGLTPQMRDEVQTHVMGERFGAQLELLEELKEAIAVTNAAVDIAVHQLRMETGFAKNDDAAFDKWMKEASAKAERELQKVPDPPLLDGDEFMKSITETFDEIWAKGFPELYPNHPINRTAQK